MASLPACEALLKKNGVGVLKPDAGRLLVERHPNGMPADEVAEIRAIVFLPVWFALQFFNGFAALAAAARTQEAVGVAWWAHVGGFLFGAAVGLGVRRRGRKSPA